MRLLVHGTHPVGRRLAALASALVLTTGLTTALTAQPASARVIGGQLYCGLDGSVAVHGVDSTTRTRAGGDYAIVEWWWWDFEAQAWQTFYSQWSFWPYFDSPQASFSTSGYTYWAARVWEWHPVTGFGSPYFLSVANGAGSYMCRSY